MPWRYDPDYAGINAYLKYDPELKAELYRRAQLGLSVARALAPRRTGALSASGYVTDDGIGGTPGRYGNGERMHFSVVFTVTYAAAATYRFRHNPDEAARAYLLAAIPVIEKG